MRRKEGDPFLTVFACCHRFIILKFFVNGSSSDNG
jgi:hypothetical protein